MFRDQASAQQLFTKAETFVRFVYRGRTVQPVPEADLQRIIEEFSLPGVAEAVPRYFRALSEEVLHKRVALYRQMSPSCCCRGRSIQLSRAKMKHVCDSAVIAAALSVRGL